MDDASLYQNSFFFLFQHHNGFKEQFDFESFF